MSLLEELSSREELHVDFHNHCQTGSNFREKPKNFNEWFWNLFLEEGFSDLTGILDRMMKTKLDGLYITNFSDSRYEDFTSKSQLEIARTNGYKIEKGDYFTFAKKNNRIIFLGKSQEIPTSQGHILFSNLHKEKVFSYNKKQSLDDALSQSDDNELIIADHPFASVKRYGVLKNSKYIEADIKKFDALERNGNFFLPFSLSNIKTKRTAKKYNKPVVSNSDGHHPKDIGNCYNVFKREHLNYSSEREFRDSINNSVRQGNFETHYRAIPFWRAFHHVFMIGICKIYKFVK